MKTFTSSVVQQGCVMLILAVIFLLVECQAEMCPDHKMSCKKGQTCCDDKEGGFGCCPYNNATCCSDGLHCCPEGTQCDLSAARCKRSSDTIKPVALIPLSTFQLDSVDSDFDSENELIEVVKIVRNGSNGTDVSDKKQCPDQRSSCPENYTCCADPSGSYACCPFPKGTCCADQIHCCPHGRKCNNSSCE